ncbi:hypothetical protein CTAYLR_009583 [Chrysophaeum taylorii]|uniref:THIF-type NAD/FAD binding fold domain-containing protein n=1 Tax=Chrysophaeum taylorii TaxID=2483200 RepID=A0AAD7UQ78_9STRA|nr:hypothetical protein CTAYLR_009583 [Chrysophaeum taylorii]
MLLLLLSAARFDGTRRLFARSFETASVAVVGLGGVGSWTVEALVRSGVGRLTLVDLDEVCVSNCNRQVCALTSTIGKPKAQVLADRCGDINPAVDVRAVKDFVGLENVERILDDANAHVVVDAIDSVPDKVALVEACARRKIPLVCVGAAGGRRDPTRVRVAKGLTIAAGDPLLKAVRKRATTHDLTAVYSEEKAQRLPAEALKRTGCDQAFGTAAFVTGAFGLAAAKAALDLLPLQTTQAAPEEDWVEMDCPCSDFDDDVAA